MSDENLTSEEIAHKGWMYKMYEIILASTIQGTSHVELLIEDLISIIICPIHNGIAKDITTYTLQSQTFNTKMRIFKRLFKERYKEVYDMHIKDLEILDKIYEFRNLLAHAVLEIRDKDVKKLDRRRIPISNYVRSNQVIYIDIEDYYKKLGELGRITMLLSNINDELYETFKELRKK